MTEPSSRETRVSSTASDLSRGHSPAGAGRSSDANWFSQAGPVDNARRAAPFETDIVTTYLRHETAPWPVIRKRTETKGVSKMPLAIITIWSCCVDPS